MVGVGGRLGYVSGGDCVVSVCGDNFALCGDGGFLRVYNAFFDVRYDLCDPGLFDRLIVDFGVMAVGSWVGRACCGRFWRAGSFVLCGDGGGRCKLTSDFVSGCIDVWFDGGRVVVVGGVSFVVDGVVGGGYFDVSGFHDFLDSYYHSLLCVKYE